MYDIISGIIDHAYIQGDSMQQYIIYACATIIPVFCVMLFDSVRFVFRAFLGRRK